MNEDKHDHVPDDLGDLIREDEEKKKSQVSSPAEMSFRAYLEVVKKYPAIAQSSHSRIYNMITSEGVEELSPAEREFAGGANKGFPFFSKQLKGVNASISEIMEFFRGGSQGLAIGKKVLLLFGPPASGKSSFAEILKRGLEEYREVPIYRIKGCPVNEEPLHILPQSKREKFSELLGVKIEGDLCPVCRHNLKKMMADGGSYYEMIVERFSISRRTSTGIGRFEPADEKAQDISDVTAKENVAVTMNPNRGYDDPYAFSFVGAIPRGNRGLVEGVEFVKKGIDPKILWTFINLNEEKLLTVPGSNMPPVSIDTVVIGHCNLIGFKWFSGDASHEALQSRIFAIPFPYAIRIKDEIEIYRKLLKQSSAVSHVAPGALELVALFAVSTRLNPDNDFSDVLEKAKFIDGQVVESVAEKRLDLKTILARGRTSDDWGKRDGMFGVSPRDIMSALSKAIVSDKGCKCLTCKKAISFIEANFDNMMGGSPELIKSWKALLSENITKEYKKWVEEIITTAFLSSYGPLALEKSKRYIADVRLHCLKKRKMSGPRPAEANADPDYKEMMKIENNMGLRSSEEKESARSELYSMYLEYMSEHEGVFSLEDFPKLKEAVNKVLLEETATNMLNLLTLSEKPATSEEAKRARKDKDDLLMGLNKMGFCEHCVHEVMEEARKVLKK